MGTSSAAVAEPPTPTSLQTLSLESITDVVLEDDASPYVWTKQVKDMSWKPLYKRDTVALEEALQRDEGKPVKVEGGRYEANVDNREMHALYWKDTKKLMRTSWWYKGLSGAFFPYEENDAGVAEELYQSLRRDISAIASSSIPAQGLKREMVMKSDTTYKIVGTAKPKASSGQVKWEIDLMQQKVGLAIFSRNLRRGMGDYTVEGEDQEGDRTPDNLVFVVHGIGEKIWASENLSDTMMSLKLVTDTLRRNTLEQRIKHLEPSTSLSSTGGCSKRRSKEDITKVKGCSLSGSGSGALSDDVIGGSQSSVPSVGEGSKHKAEFIPIEWYDAIHEEDGDLTRRIRSVTLPSVPLFRQFANDAVMDVLLYLDPRSRQIVLQAVGKRMNQMYHKFVEQNPGFDGRVMMVGHSLGTVIVFDLLAHQKCQESSEIMTPLDPSIDYPQLDFQTHAFVALGSPIGMFLTVRDANLPASFRFPTANKFFNVFHPYDPVAYRIEPILQDAMVKLEPALVPHHEGGQTLVTKIRSGQKGISGSMLSLATSATSIWGGIRNLAHTASLAAAATPQGDSDLKTSLLDTSGVSGPVDAPIEVPNEEPNVEAVALNDGKRFDYALQEGISEPLNEYLSAISAHACYFTSKDVALFLVKIMHDMDFS